MVVLKRKNDFFENHWPMLPRIHAVRCSASPAAFNPAHVRGLAHEEAACIQGMR
jgi:hypothetical protein